jgi:polyisoprenoid-binding protein YceI
MTTTTSTTPENAASLADGTWVLDPARSSVEFHVRHFYGLMTVKGHFDRFKGTLDLAAKPAITLTIDAGSLDTKQAKRDAHLRGPDFFDVEKTPEVRFVSESATLDGDRLAVRGQLHAAGRTIPLAFDAPVRPVDDGFEIDASAISDHRELGMTWSPLGILRSPSTLAVHGRLVRAS